MSEMYDHLVDFVINNQSKVGDMTELEVIDHFEEITNGIAPKICLIITLVSEFLISDVVAGDSFFKTRHLMPRHLMPSIPIDRFF